MRSLIHDHSQNFKATRIRGPAVQSRHLPRQVALNIDARSQWPPPAECCGPANEDPQKGIGRKMSRSFNETAVLHVRTGGRRHNGEVVLMQVRRYIYTTECRSSCNRRRKTKLEALAGQQNLLKIVKL